MQTIQHRYPFLLVDRIIELEPGVRAVGLKNVTINEPFMPGYFPGNPVMPNVLIIEHAAQVGCALLLSLPSYRNKLGVFAAIENVEFHRAVTPGDQLITEVVMLRLTGRAGKIRVACRVGDDPVMEGQYTFLLLPDPSYKESHA